MHGPEGEGKKRKRHMWPGPALVAASVANSPPIDSFCKDGRQIGVGDCALFQAGDFPPFIGIIRWFSSDKVDNCLRLGVNWLYRPTDVKLSKGVLLEAAPNEVFYSFHKDEIPAASLLHPCKVAFLHKGVELPSGISSFVCRRVYDIANNCLWWLTDQDYIHEHQEEVDHLLDKTRLEMHAAVQSGGRSPKSLNSPSSTTQQLKPNSDNSVQNSSTSLTQSKGRKRERDDPSSELSKRERSNKVDHGDSSISRLESSVKSEIVKITDKEGGLTSFEGVEKLVHLMQLDGAEKKVGFTDRVMFADVIATTDRYDCLGWFVQLGGVLILNDWLQEAHKGKNGDGSSPKESDKYVDVLLLALLRALDKLPVNLNALQSCHVGRSVNHLRSHKNIDIQKKARGLVDTWKKRVEAEMNMNDAKSGPCQQVSWSEKSVLSETHGGNRRPVSSSDICVKSSVTSPSISKVTSVKLGQVDTIVKFPSASLESVKCSSLLPPSIMVGSRGGSDMPLTPIKEEKSSSSNNSHSCVSDHAKTVGSGGKEDMRSSTAGSLGNNRNSTASSRSRKLINGFVGAGVTGAQKDVCSAKSANCNKNAPQEKLFLSGLSCEKAIDVPVADVGHAHRLIVRLPNPGRNPSQSPSGGSSEEPFVVGSRVSSPSLPEKQGHHASKVKRKTDACQSSNAVDGENNESWQSSEVKEEGDKSPRALPNDEESRITEEISEQLDEFKGTSSSENEKGVNFSELKSGRWCGSSYSSMNALIESCVKYSEADEVILPEGDDMGMNLLASVATGEMSRSELNSPIESTQMNSLSVEASATANDNDNGPDPEEQGNTIGSPQGGSELLHSSSHAVAEYSISADIKNDHLSPGHKPQLEQNEEIVASEVDSRSDNNPGETSDNASKSSSSDLPMQKSPFADVRENDSKCEGAFRVSQEKEVCINEENCDGFADLGGKKIFTFSHYDKMANQVHEKIEGNIMMSVQSNLVPGPACDGCDANEFALKAGVISRVNSKLCASVKADGIDVNLRHEGSVMLEFHLPEAGKPVDASDKLANGRARSGAKKVEPETLLKKKETLGRMRYSEPVDDEKKSENTISSFAALNNQEGGCEDGRKTDEVLVDNNMESSLQVRYASDRCRQPLGSSKSNPEAEGTNACDFKAEVFEAVSGTNAKLTFDLNEGFSLEDGNQQGDLSGTSRPPTANLSGSFVLSACSIPINLQHASVTVAAPAKGPFLPSEELLRSKGELGWKGSAATSAFRRAEPRKAFDISLGAAGVFNDACVGKSDRPPLDIDLNVPDERVVEDMGFKSSVPAGGSQLGPDDSLASHRFSGGLDFDLNRVDECVEQKSSGTTGRLDIPLVTGGPSSSTGFLHGEANIARSFDLNNGPGPEDMSGVEAVSHSQHQFKNNLPFLPSIPGVKNNSELGSLTAWFPHGNSYSAMSIQSFLPDREQHPYSIVSTAGTHQRILSSAVGGSFGGDFYRGPMLSSSMPFAAVSAPFPYAGFPFGSSYPLPSTSFSGASTTLMDSSSGGGSCFPSVPSQLLGPVCAVPSTYPRPYMVGPPDSGIGAENSQKWSQHGWDLNAGPGNLDLEGRDERLPLSSLRQISVSSSQPPAVEQARIHQTAKRKEPEGGWDVERFTFKQPSWQ